MCHVKIFEPFVCHWNFLFPVRGNLLVHIKDVFSRFSLLLFLPFYTFCANCNCHIEQSRQLTNVKSTEGE